MKKIGSFILKYYTTVKTLLYAEKKAVRYRK